MLRGFTHYKPTLTSLYPKHRRPTLLYTTNMLGSSISARTLGLAPRGGLLGRSTAALMSTTRGITESPCSQIPSPLPGLYRESTDLWLSNNSERSSPVKAMRNEAELTELIASAAPGSLVVVKFHANLCHASKAIEGKFEKTAAEFSDMEGDGKVHFAKICFDNNRQLCQKMGILSVPHVQIYSRYSGKIADFSIAPLKYNTLTSLLTERRDAGNRLDK